MKAFAQGVCSHSMRPQEVGPSPGRLANTRSLSKASQACASPNRFSNRVLLNYSPSSASWKQVVSQAEARGRVLVLPDLVEVQGKRFDDATVIIATHVGGMEDIPVSHPRFCFLPAM